jgi:hypothetical protein
MRERLRAYTFPASEPFPHVSLHHATKLLIASFNHSQGSFYVQSLLYEYFSRLHPEARFSDAFAHELAQHTIAIFYPLLGGHGSRATGHKRVAKYALEKNVQAEVGRMQNLFGSKLDPEIDVTLRDRQLLQELADQFIERDYHWLIEKRHQRPNRRVPVTGETAASHWTDRAFSYVVVHALQGRPTEVPELTWLYGELGRRYREVLRTQNRPLGLHPVGYRHLPAILRHYNRRHPDQPSGGSTPLRA